MELTLKQWANLLDNFDFYLPFSIVDINLWDSEAGGYTDFLGFEDCHKLSDAVKHIGTSAYAGAEYLPWLDKIVTDVQVEQMVNGNILKVELSA